VSEVSENEVIAALLEIRGLLKTVVSRFDGVEVRLSAVEARLDVIQGVSGSLAGAQ
jgi:hypothetical protein